MSNQKEVAKTYKITLLDQNKKLIGNIKVLDSEYILDAADDQGINLPYSCRSGQCISCVGKIIEGKVEQDHSFLKPKELEAGFILTCKSYPRSDCVIMTDQEDALLDL
jgi:ferredoxin